MNISPEIKNHTLHWSAESLFESWFQTTWIDPAEPCHSPCLFIGDTPVFTRSSLLKEAFKGLLSLQKADAFKASGPA
ncbi:MAG: hypothetical protein V4646_10240 [Pseudomonadota bacterium]